jgi:signal peptidase II
MNMGVEGRQLIPGLADFRPAWNRGVSFSLFVQNTDTGRHLLMAVLSVITIGVLILAWRAQNRLAAIALGLVLGGALGNLLDRGVYGGVFDFLALHLGSVPLFVCNIPDIAISAGALLLVAETLMVRPQST